MPGLGQLQEGKEPVLDDTPSTLSQPWAKLKNHVVAQVDFEQLRGVVDHVPEAVYLIVLATQAFPELGQLAFWAQLCILADRSVNGSRFIGACALAIMSAVLPESPQNSLNVGLVQLRRRCAG